jgi:hypothetical protein
MKGMRRVDTTGKINPGIPEFPVRFIQAYGVPGVIKESLTSKKFAV